MCDTLGVDMREGICSLTYQMHNIYIGMATNIIDNVPLVIIWSRNGGYGRSGCDHGCRPTRRYVLVITNDGPTFMQLVNHLRRP